MLNHLSFSVKHVFIAVCVLIFTTIVGVFMVYTKTPVTTLKIAVIDGERLKVDAKVFTKVADMVKQEVEKVKNEFTPHQTALEKAYENLKKEKNAEKVKKKTEEYEKKLAEIEQIFIKKQEYLHRIQEYLYSLLDKTVLQLINDTAKKHNINIIHNRYVEDKLLILYHDHTLDLTDEVVKIIDDTLHDIQIPKELLKNDK